MHALQDLGATLVSLSPAQLARLRLPERLADAIEAARAITKFEARRRQMQYIGRLMREIDAAPISAQVELLRNARQRENARQHDIEAWRDRLLADEHALNELALEVGALDSQHLRTLIRNARKEQSLAKPPKAARALFRELRVLLNPAIEPAGDSSNAA